MKKVLFGFICLLALSLTVSAQQPPQGGGNRQMPTPEESAKRMTDQFKTDLKLTDQQVPKVQEVNLTYAKAMSKLREGMTGGGGGDFTAMREQMTKLETQRGTALEKILTKEQMDAYKKWFTDRPQMGRQCGQGGQGGQGQGQGQRRQGN